MNLKTVKIAELKPHPKNPRQHPDSAIAKLTRSIQEFGWTNPVLVSKDGFVLAGHARLKAAENAGITEVPVIQLDLEGAKADAYLIADNKTQDLTDWDLPLLKDLLQELDTGEFDIEITGFASKEIADLINQLHQPEDGLTDDDEVPEPQESICKPGDLWVLGTHRLYCGDATVEADVAKLMAGEKADLVFTDPPYNVNYGSIVGHPSYKRTKGRTRINKTREGHPYWKDREAKGIGNAGQTIINDNMSPEEWDNFVRGYMQNLMGFNTGVFYICMSNKEMYSNKHIFEELGGHWASFIIWHKDLFVMGMQDYQRQYEPLLYGWKEGCKHHWCGDRDQSDVWDIKRPRSSPEHPTMKPVELCERAISNSSLVNNIVLDPFGGAGSTLIACEKLNRRCFMTEIDPHYVDVIVSRWEAFTGKKAELVGA